MPLSNRAPTSDRRPWACQRVVVPCARYWASSSRGVLYPRGCRMRVAARGQLVPQSRHVGSRRPPNRGGSRRYEHQRTGLWFGRPGDVASAVDAAPSGSFSTTLVSRMVPSHRHGVYGGLAIRTVHRSQDLVRRRSANTRPAESPQACDRHHKASDVRAEPSNA